MTDKLTDGLESVGNVEGLTGDLNAAYLKLDSRGAIVSLPRADSVYELFKTFVDKDESGIPSTLRFQDTKGTFVLADCHDAGGTVSTSGVGVTRIRAPRVIEAGDNDLVYDDVDGMTTELDGLSAWTGMSTVTQNMEWRDQRPAAVVLRAENQDEIPLGGRAAATVESSFTFNPSPKGNVFGITDRAILRTRSDDPWSWSEHAAVHHMLQDLMCLLFGRPCLSRIVSVKREDDQPYATDGDRRRTWREVYEPGFGRLSDGVIALDRGKDRPLFYLKDVDPASLAKWIDRWDLWSRPTWIAVTTMFQRGSTVESKLLQIGVALEALGYALSQESSAAAAGTPKYPELLELVTSAVEIEHPRIYDGLSTTEWRRDFNETFKGTKHADNPLPNGLSAHRFASQGMNLIRAWLATRLGVQPARLAAGFERV